MSEKEQRKGLSWFTGVLIMGAIGTVAWAISAGPPPQAERVTIEGVAVPVPKGARKTDETLARPGVSAGRTYRVDDLSRGRIRRFYVRELRRAGWVLDRSTSGWMFFDHPDGAVLAILPQDGTFKFMMDPPGGGRTYR